MAKRWMLVIDEYEEIVKNAVNMLSGYLSGVVSYILPVKYTRDMTEQEYAENNIIAVGKGKTHFEILKFRTMYADVPKDVPTHLLADPASKITKIGRFLRKSSLDELPQIFNILKGEMSIIGPRPALWNQFDLIEERDKYGANDVRPGLTGLAQVMGRDELPIDIKAKYDGDYVKDISFSNDVKIFFRTIFSVASADGIKEGKQE